MGTNAYSGFVIELSALLRDFPETLATLRDMYPDRFDGPDYQASWALPSDLILIELYDFAISHIHEDITLDLWGSWWGDFTGLCPFKDGEVYVVLDKDQLASEEIGTPIKDFMQAHDIPAEALTYQEWQCGE